MEKETNDEKDVGKGLIGLGIFNLALTLILISWRKLFFSAVLILAYGIGIYSVVYAFKNKKIFIGVVCFLLNGIAILLYARKFGLIFLQYLMILWDFIKKIFALFQ
ncbi:MAG: hypothetical protein NC313_00655 [Butyrivibrio sp.]|nr:hypothetical protein [Butyrivibrio sp.]